MIKRWTEFWTLAGYCLLLGACAGMDTTADRRVGNLVLKDVPEVPESVLKRLRQYQNTRSASVRGWIGEAMVVATRFGDTTQLHKVSEPLGAREQITFFDEPITQAFLPPPSNDRGFIYARDIGGSEFYQLFWYDWESGGHRLLSDGKSRYGGVTWSNDGEQFAYYTTERNGRNRDIHIQNLDGSVVVALEQEQGAWFAEDFSPGDTRLLVSRYVSINESQLYELELATRQLRPLLDPSLQVSIGQALYDADGTGIYFTSDLGAEFMRLHHLDLASGDIEVLSADVPWNIESIALAPNKQLLAMSINEDASSRIVVWRLPEHTPLALPELPVGVLSGLRFSADSSQLALSLNTATSPTDVWALSLTQRSLQRWTMSEVGGLDSQAFVEPSLERFETFDQFGGEARQIPVFVYKPPGNGPHPVLISIHGGPEGQYRPYFSSTTQYLVGELGMAVVAPNVRGSSGYGKSYLKLDNGVLREDSVRDIGALIDWIGQQPDLDSSRIVVSGGSYGGYMVLAALTHYSDRLAAGVESVGISNFVSFLTNTQAYRQDLRRAEYGDERDPLMREHLEAISPLNQVQKITRPLMISQGANDPRVPASESKQIYEALKSSGTPVWYVLAEDEGHGFRKKGNRDYNLAVMTLFLETFVLN
jgi:dipeptidyl aminopeptidase/acylaminoacyl peptidase